MFCVDWRISEFDMNRSWRDYFIVSTQTRAMIEDVFRDDAKISGAAKISPDWDYRLVADHNQSPKLNLPSVCKRISDGYFPTHNVNLAWSGSCHVQYGDCSTLPRMTAFVLTRRNFG